MSKTDSKKKKQTEVINRAEAEALCAKTDLDIDEMYNDYSEAIVSFKKNKLERDIKIFLKHREENDYYKQEEKKRQEYLKNRSFFDKIIKDDYQNISFGKVMFILAFIGILFCVAYFLIKSRIGDSCLSGEEPNVFRGKCIKRACNGGITDEGYFRQNRLYFLDTFVYEYSQGSCVSKCYDLNEQYHNRYANSNTKFYEESYYFWKDGKCQLLPQYKYKLSEEVIFRRDMENDLRKREDIDVIRRRDIAEKELKKYFFKKLKDNPANYDVKKEQITPSSID